MTAACSLAILFWFYKDLETCANRLESLRRLNPGLPLYGLWGGDPTEADAVRQRVGALMDDLYIFTEDRPALWKWQHGDRLIAAWHRDRGHALPWDSLVLVQWDMLILKPIRRAFAMLQPGQALFSGLRPESELSGWWGWIKGEDPEKARDLAAFRDRLARDHGYEGPLWCCLFIVVCLPRRFLDLYGAAGPPEEGFLEYKMPTLAHIFGIPFCTDHPYRPWWASDPTTRDAPLRQRLLNAVGDDPDFITVLEEAADRHGSGIIHPYRQPVPGWLSRWPLAWLARHLGCWRAALKSARMFR